MERLNVDLDMLNGLIKAAQNVSQLREARDHIQKAFQAYPGMNAREWNVQLNGFHDSLIRKAVGLAEFEMVKSGWGNPPAPYAFVLFGSGGRKEQSLWSDQDNGLIYADSENGDGSEWGSELESETISETDSYFARFSDAIQHHLSSIGYPPCDGSVLCTNSQWRKPISRWLRMMQEWAAEPNWEHIRYLLILADLRTVYGDERLSQRVRQAFMRHIANDPALSGYMLKNTLHHKVTLGFFGQILKERHGEEAGSVDLKYGAYIPMVNGIRLMALLAGIEETSSLGRLNAFAEPLGITREQLEHLTDAFCSVLKLRSMTLHQIKNGEYSSRGFLPLDGLTKEEIEELKQSLRAGEQIQKLVKAKIEIK